MRNLRYQPLQTIAYVAGKAPGIEMIRGVKTHAIHLRLTAQATIAGAGGVSVLAEGVQRLIDRVKLIENGQTTFEATGRGLGYLTSRAQRQAINVVQLSGFAAAVYQLSADFVIDFASIYGADPSETCYVERDSRFPTVIEFTFAADPNAALIGGVGLTLNSLSIVPTQVYDPVSEVMPFFLPRLKLVSSGSIVGTITNFPIYLYPEAGARIESVILHSLTDNVTSATVLNGNVSLRGDKFRYVDQVSRFTLLNENRRFLNQPPVSLSYMELHSRFYGKLSEMFVSGQDDNLRVEVDTLNGGTVSAIDAYLLQKLPIPGYTRALPRNW